ncbi:hypothetical protein SNEBB_004975 [Seison nebaliae]|nr:hypothetical protein SNEBB_004975 [Seison nebaliae]
MDEFGKILNKVIEQIKNDRLSESIPFENVGQLSFVEWLQNKCDFISVNSSDKIYIVKQSNELNDPNILISTKSKNGNLFSKPIVTDVGVLPFGLKVPNSSLQIKDIEELIGENFEVEVINVRKQLTSTMLFKEFVDYWNNKKNDFHDNLLNFDNDDDDCRLNILSLECSKTAMNQEINLPTFVERISWLRNGIVGKTIQDEFPSILSANVDKYCLISTQHSYTDFHIDFGGSSVWYHLLKGNKCFYIYPPTKFFIHSYKMWTKYCANNLFDLQLHNINYDLDDSEEKLLKKFLCWFPNFLKVAYQFWPNKNNSDEFWLRGRYIELKESSTLFLPSGWIHSVHTTQHSIVFGGNFLTSYHINHQMNIYKMERQISTPGKYIFPFFEECHWLTAIYLSDDLKKRLRLLTPNSDILHKFLKKKDSHQMELVIRPIIYEMNNVIPRKELLVQYNSLVIGLKQWSKMFTLGRTDKKSKSVCDGNIPPLKLFIGQSPSSTIERLERLMKKISVIQMHMINSEKKLVSCL